MEDLWNEVTEKDFFESCLKNFSSPEQIFYITDSGEYLAYWPKNYSGEKKTLQSRNSLIGSYTEKFTADIFKSLLRTNKLFVIQGAICEQIGLTSKSPADVAICTVNKKILEPDEIKLLIEVKMSIVWNWQYFPQKLSDNLICIGDYMSHQGNPGLLRSDSMLKAIGKSINIRVSGNSASKIPILVLGNTPIANSYYDKVDHLCKSGVIQGFYSLNPTPIIDDNRNIKSTKELGFIRIDSIDELNGLIENLLNKDNEYFSSMINKQELGRIIELANKKPTYEEKVEEFLKLIRK
ncbi:MAG: hypothetical protein JW776_06695 [Candidatus Lokiarchaeota archaeon]|nr:hypothetical protein [Candidatus Lokiarchaeota archaeon]